MLGSSIRRVLTAVAITICLFTGRSVFAQADVIVGDINGVEYWGQLGNDLAYSAGTTSCNIGTVNLLWISNTNQHPVIGQGIYRHYDGKFEQIGISWLKHGFLALDGNLCSPCNATPGNQELGVGCSDPYGAGLNGSQPDLGPRSEVNAFDGSFMYPPGQPGMVTDLRSRRIIVPAASVDPVASPGARFFFEGQYVTPDDAAAGNGENNVSYREYAVDPVQPGYEMNPVTPTVAQEPAIYAWQTVDPNVEIVEFNVPNEGQIVLAWRVTDNQDGTWTYDYAMFNNNSHESIRRFEVPLIPGLAISNTEFFHTPVHSGEPYSASAWSILTSGVNIEWSCPNLATNANANALRWGRMFNYRFTANSAPVAGTVNLNTYVSDTAIAVPLVDIPGVPPTVEPSNFTCVGAPAGAALSWTVGDVYDSIEIYRDGSLLATLGGMAESYFDDTAQQLQGYTYSMRAFDSMMVPTDLLFCSTAIPFGAQFVRGDTNADGASGLGDVIAQLQFLFVPGAPTPDCTSAFDIDDNGTLNLSDAIALLTSLFVAGSDPIPAPTSCGFDPTSDSIDCQSHAICP